MAVATGIPRLHYGCTAGTTVLRLLLWLGAQGHRMLTFYDLHIYIHHYEQYYGIRFIHMHTETL